MPKKSPTVVENDKMPQWVKMRKLTFKKGASYVQPFLYDLPTRNSLEKIVKGKMKICPSPAS